MHCFYSVLRSYKGDRAVCGMPLYENKCRLFSIPATIRKVHSVCTGEGYHPYPLQALLCDGAAQGYNLKCYVCKHMSLSFIETRGCI